MKPGQRYMEAREAAQIEDLRERRLFRPEEWPPEYIPAPGSNDDRGQRNRFGYLSDGMWMNMPSPGTHIEAGISEFYVSQNPGSWRRPVSIAEKIAALYAPTPVELRRPWWRFW